MAVNLLWFNIIGNFESNFLLLLLIFIIYIFVPVTWGGHHILISVLEWRGCFFWLGQEVEQTSTRSQRYSGSCPASSWWAPPQAAARQSLWFGSAGLAAQRRVLPESSCGVEGKYYFVVLPLPCILSFIFALGLCDKTCIFLHGQTLFFDKTCAFPQGKYIFY